MDKRNLSISGIQEIFNETKEKSYESLPKVIHK